MLYTTSHPAQLTDQLKVWVNGHLYSDHNKARITAMDAGFIVGNGAFEAIKVTEQGPFAVRRHLERLDRSARALGLAAPDHDLIRRGIADVLRGRTYGHGKLRITYTAGLGPLGSQAAFGPPTVVVAADARERSAPSARVVTAPWTRNEHGALAGVKSTSYAENVRTLAYASANGASEAILLNTALNVCEGTGSNLFCVFGTRIITPPLEAGPLAGITRDLILEWCDVQESDLTLDEALSADEIFLTSTLRDVQAVHQWDTVVFDSDGPQTAAAVATFARRSAEDLEP